MIEFRLKHRCETQTLPKRASSSTEKAGKAELTGGVTVNYCDPFRLPDGFTAGAPTSICFIGNIFGEAKILAAAKIYPDATPFHLKHPKLD